MTRITQITAAALVTVFASTAFVSTAQAAHGLRVCEVTSKTPDQFRDSCTEKEKRRYIKQPVPGAAAGPAPVQRSQNFRSLSSAELSAIAIRDGNGGGGGRGGATGKP